MKQLKLVVAALFLIFSGTMHAQVAITVSVGTRPAWGPAEADGVRYYYLPDIHMYYDVNSSNYIYLSNGAWIHSSRVPYAYRNYDFYGAYKVSLRDYRGERPYDNYNDHHKSYPDGYNRGHEQKTYGDKPGRGNSEGKEEHHGNSGHDKK